MGEIPGDAGEALTRLLSLGFPEDAAHVLFGHFHDAEQRGKAAHGYARIPWLESQPLDPLARPVLLGTAGGVERWDGAGALGYLVLAAVCDRIVSAQPADTRLVVAQRCFPTGVLGYWVRRLAAAGFVAVLTATSPRRLPHPDGGSPLTGTNPLAIGIPSSQGDPIVVDVSMGAVTHGDVLTGRAHPEQLIPFGGAQAHKGFALAVGLELLVAALAGPEPGAVLLVARPEHDPVPGFRELAKGFRLPGDAPSALS